MSSLSRAARAVLLLAIVLRVAVCALLGPDANDDHYEVIELILRDGRLPLSDAGAQTFQPPLYYVLSLPFAAIGGKRFVQFFTLLLSIANVFLLVRLLDRTPLIASARGRWHAMLLVALLPPFVLFGSVITNDALAMLAGTIALLAAEAFIDAPSTKRAALAGLAAGAGLLTKGTLVAHAGVLFAIVVVIAFRRMPRGRALAAVALFVAITAVTGAYKFVENQIHFGRPVVHNMDFAPVWMRAQQPTLINAWSYVDLDLRKLWRHPHAGVENPRSAPLLFYATLWHAYVPVSNFKGTVTIAPIAGRVTYIAAIVPSLLIALGLWIGVKRRSIAVAFLAVNVALVMVVGIRYDAWSCFHSRLLFASFAAIALAYAWGIDAVTRRWPKSGRAVDLACGVLYVAFAMFYGIEAAWVAATVLG